MSSLTSNDYLAAGILALELSSLTAASKVIGKSPERARQMLNKAFRIAGCHHKKRILPLSFKDAIAEKDYWIGCLREAMTD